MSNKMFIKSTFKPCGVNIPLALNIEEGGDMLQPMAIGAIGGLALGLMVTLFLLPCLYVIFTREKALPTGSEEIKD